NVVLSLMRDQGFLSPEDTELWKAYPLVLTTNRTNYGDVAPYFVEWLRATQLDARFGRDLYEGGLRIYTTLDLDMQEAAERAISTTRSTTAPRRRSASPARRSSRSCTRRRSARATPSPRSWTIHRSTHRSSSSTRRRGSPRTTTTRRWA